MSDINDQRPPYPGGASDQQGPVPPTTQPGVAGQQSPAQPAPQPGVSGQQAQGQTAARPAGSAQDNSWYAAAQARAQAREEGQGASQFGATAAAQHASQHGAASTAQHAAASAGQNAAASAAQATQRQARPVPPTTQPGQTAQQPAQQRAYVPPVPPQGPGVPGAPAPQPEKPKRRHPAVRAALCGLLGGLVGAGALVAALHFAGVIGNSTTITTNGGSSQSITINPADDSTTLANAVAAKTLSSVVSINVTTSDAEGVGSGVILDTDGNILTNYHVVDGAQTISVSANGNSYDATVVGSDESSDLAVIKIDPGSDTLTPIEVGDSSSLQVGDWVMSIGSPFGLEQSVSTGIVSSLYRSTMLQGTTGNTIYTNLIQTDAAINPGNSGGALVNDEGKLVGINSIIESASGSSSGVGFAIPGNYAVQVAKKIISGETVTHAYLGGSFQTVTAQNARRNNLSVNQGAYVAEVTSGSPADQAGIKQGDIITAIDDQEITSSDGVVLAVRSHNVGDTVQVKLMRGSQEMTVSVTLGSDEALQSQQDDQSSSQGSLLEQYLNQYGYGNGGSGSNGSSGTGRGGSLGGSSYDEGGATSSNGAAA